MDPFTLEMSVHRIGGTDRYERTFMPHAARVYPDGETYANVPGLLFSHAFTRVTLNRWTPVRPALWSAQAMLSNENCQPVGPPRPILVSTLPSDVPLYSAHIGTDPEWGVYSLGLRVPTAAWSPGDLETLAEAVHGDV